MINGDVPVRICEREREFTSVFVSRKPVGREIRACEVNVFTGDGPLFNRFRNGRPRWRGARVGGMKSALGNGELSGKQVYAFLSPTGDRRPLFAKKTNCFDDFGTSFTKCARQFQGTLIMFTKIFSCRIQACLYLSE